MSLWRGSRAGALENPNVPITMNDLASLVGWSQRTAAGVAVTQDSALRQITVVACQRIIAETVATLPVGVFRRDGQLVRREPTPAWMDQPNPDLDWVELIEDLLYGCLGDGNGIAQVVRAGDRVLELYPQDPQQVTLQRGKDRRLFYRMADGTPWASESVLHVRAFRRPGSLRGISPIEKHRQALGLALAAEEFGAAFFGNSATANGVIETAAKLTREQAQILVDTFMRQHGGLAQAHKPGVLTEGATWKQVTIPPEHAQFIQTQQFSVSQIARMYRVAPHLVGDVERSTSWGTGIEEQNIAFVVYTLLPWIVRLERVLTRLHRPPAYPGGVIPLDAPYVKFNVEGLLRGSLKTRYEAYAIGRQWGWESANSVLALEDREPIDGGDTYLSPLNMIDAKDTDTRPLRDRAQAAYFLGHAQPPLIAAQLAGFELTDTQVADIEAFEPPHPAATPPADPSVPPDDSTTPGTETP